MKYIGVIVENPDLYEYLSGYNNLKLVARIYKIKNSKLNETYISFNNKNFKFIFVQRI